MRPSTVLELILAAVIATPPQPVMAIGSADADLMFNSFNNVFLTTSGTSAFYKSAINKTGFDGTWQASLDILVAEDVYERTGDPKTQTLINNLLTTWLQQVPPPWSWDGWNDDIGWFTLALVRGYQMTGNTNFLTQAEYGFNYAFGRGWDTQYNGGGIWEENPEYAAKENPPRDPTKEALSNDSLGKVACLLYQSTHTADYLTKCRQIYDWVWNHLYNHTTGQIYTGIDRSNNVNTASAAYNQGTFLDFAHLVYLIQNDNNVYNDAVRAINYARDHLTVNGVFSNSASYLSTWADEMARGAGHFVRDNGLWSDYYTWMLKNADAIVANKRSDLGITWNAWDTPTPADNGLITSKFAGAASWLQFTPAVQPDRTGGIHVVTNGKTGMAIDSAGTYGNGNIVVQWGLNGGQNQRWLFTPNYDNTWNIVSLSTWQALDNPASSMDNNATMIQWRPIRGSNQRWIMNKQGDGTYIISNQASGKCLDGASTSTNGAGLIQWTCNGSPQQYWILQ